MATHCQICGRAIRTIHGNPLFEGELKLWELPPEHRDPIAHHGYQRPWQQGWQSASCFGARWRSYEVACDALPPAIAATEKALEHAKVRQAEFLASPPEVLVYVRHDAYGKERVRKELARPEGFKNDTPDNHMGGTYPNEYSNRRSNNRRTVEGLTEDLAGLRARLAAWVAPK